MNTEKKDSKKLMAKRKEQRSYRNNLSKKNKQKKISSAQKKFKKKNPKKLKKAKGKQQRSYNKNLSRKVKKTFSAQKKFKKKNPLSKSVQKARKKFKKKKILQKSPATPKKYVIFISFHCFHLFQHGSVCFFFLEIVLNVLIKNGGSGTGITGKKFFSLNITRDKRVNIVHCNCLFLTHIKKVTLQLSVPWRGMCSRF